MSHQCRTCLKTSNDVIDLISDGLSAKLEEISSMEILPDYGFSTLICDECMEKIYLYNRFRAQIIKMQEALPGKIKEIKSQDTMLESECRMCLTASENLSDLFCDGLPYKIEIISSLEITRDDRLTSKICGQCQETVRSLYDFRITIIRSNAIISERLMKREAAVTLEIQMDDSTLHLNESADGVLPIEIIAPEMNHIGAVKKRIYLYKCVHCNYCTRYYCHMQKHSKTHEEATIVCYICGKLFSNMQISVHLKSHSTVKVTCHVCGQILKHEVTLKAHLRLHSKTERFECLECGKYYKSKPSYKRHLNFHKGIVIKDYECSLCDRRFFGKSKLDVHFRSHTGERPYLCTICNKGFSSTTARKTHIRQHTQEKPYTCRYCDAAFKQAVLVRRHMKSKHPEKVVEKTSA